MATNSKKITENTFNSYESFEVESIHELDSVQDLKLPEERGYEPPISRYYSITPKFLVGNISLSSIQPSRSLHPSIRNKQPSLVYMPQKSILWDENEKNIPLSEYSAKGRSRSKSNSSKMTKNTDIMRTGMSIGMPKMDSILEQENQQKQRDLQTFKTVVHASSGLAVPNSHRNSLHTLGETSAPFSPQLLNIGLRGKDLSPTPTDGTRTNTLVVSGGRDMQVSYKLNVLDEASPKAKEGKSETRPDSKQPSSPSLTVVKPSSSTGKTSHKQQTVTPMSDGLLSVADTKALLPSPVLESFPLTRKGTGRPDE
jgi:hypothetical protein